MSLKIYAPLLTFATKHGRYLRNKDKEEIGTLSFVRASSEPVMPSAFLHPSAAASPPAPTLSLAGGPEIRPGPGWARSLEISK